MWYFTSPPPSVLRGSTSSNRANTSAAARPTMCTITFSRPRWLIASMAFSAPCSAAALRIESSSGISAALALERIAFRAEIARLQDLLENLRLHQQIENSRPIGLRRFRFHALLHPQARARGPGCA